MAQVCRLANESAGTTYDFLTGVLKIRLNTWQERPSRDGNMISTFELVGVDSDVNIIDAAEDKIGELIEVHELADENDRYRESLWFEYKADAEPAKRSLIHSMTFYQSPVGKFHPLLGKKGAIYKMAITHGVWEDRAVINGGFTGAKSTLGSTATLAAIDGSRPARMSSFQVQGISGGGGPIDRIWAGIRPTRYGVASMVTLWELEDGTPGTDATVAEVAGASPADGADNEVTIDFSTNTLINRVSMTVDDAISGGNFRHAIGRYMVLLRYSMSSGATDVIVEMRTGYPDNTTFAPHGEHVLDGTTAWRLEPLGEIQIPSFPLRENVGDVDAVARNFTIQIHAIRTAGANLHLDALILIPSEHFVSIENATVEYDGAAAKVFLFITEYGEEIAYQEATDGLLKTNLVSSFNNWRLPVEGGLLVVAGERASSSVITDTISYAVNYYPRHRNHREA
jgi:hypothetical protein